jgi:hypothetical protein
MIYCNEWWGESKDNGGERSFRNKKYLKNRGFEEA